MILTRNEEKYIQKCLRGIQNQTVKPNKIIILDDASTDRTPEILSTLKEPFQVVRFERKDQLHFYGRALREASKYLDDGLKYIGILDADTYIEKRYYEKLLPRINSGNGMCSGIIHGEEISKRVYGLNMYYVYGANRVYTKDCWNRLNDGQKILKDVFYGLDTYHYLKALMIGYVPELFMDVQSWSLRKRLRFGAQMYVRGLSSYRLGYYLWFMILRALKDQSPIMLTGYLKGLFAQIQQWKTKKYIQETQLDRIKQLIGLKPHKRNVKEVAHLLSDAIMYQRRFSKGLPRGLPK